MRGVIPSRQKVPPGRYLRMLADATTTIVWDMDDLAAAGKYNLHGNLLVTGNVQFNLDTGGLRAKIVP